MASTKELKKRIGTVTNTQQTTRAMKIVSAAKLRKAQLAILANRPYALQVNRLIRLVASMTEKAHENPLIRPEKPVPDSEKNILLVLVTSDRGFCAGFNTNIMKKGLAWYEENKSRYKSIDLAFVGRKSHDFFSIRGFKPTYAQEFGRKVEFEDAKALNQVVVDRYLKGEVHEVKFVYNYFKNAITQDVTVEHFLPLYSKGEELLVKEDIEDKVNVDQFVVKPDADELLTNLLKKHFGLQIFRILLESQAGEHGARMAAMDNATTNAGKMIKSLTLQYNKQRQAAITTEMLEIIAGSESQKGA